MTEVSAPEWWAKPVGEFTPTTEQVKEAYRFESPNVFFSVAEAEMEFDRWRAAERASAWAEGWKKGERWGYYSERESDQTNIDAEYGEESNPYRSQEAPTGEQP